MSGRVLWSCSSIFVFTPNGRNFTYTIFELCKLSFSGLTLKLTWKTELFVPQVYDNFLLTPCLHWHCLYQTLKYYGIMLLFDCMSGFVIGHVEDNISLCMNQPLLVVSSENLVLRMAGTGSSYWISIPSTVLTLLFNLRMLSQMSNYFSCGTCNYKSMWIL